MLEAALRDQVCTGCPGAILEVMLPEQEFCFSEAQGLFARNDTRPLNRKNSFRAASVTKIITAAAAVLLASKKYFDLDDPVRYLLPERVGSMLESLEGLRNIDELTVRRLLNHTSGLHDYFFDDRFRERVKADPDHIWQPEELVEFAVQNGELLFQPGTDFAYGDTGYVLVGIAIERLLDSSLADAFRSLIFDPLGMDSSYLEWREEDRCELSHHYEGDKDLTGLNLSFDWAGGGLITTAGDLTKFLLGLFGCRLFEDHWLSELTKSQMRTRWRPHSSARYISYGLGMGTNFAFGEKIIGATGVWGAFAYYWPAGNATITGTLNLTGADRQSLLDHVIRALIQVVAPVRAD